MSRVQISHRPPNKSDTKAGFSKASSTDLDGFDPKQARSCGTCDIFTYIFDSRLAALSSSAMKESVQPKGDLGLVVF